MVRRDLARARVHVLRAALRAGRNHALGRAGRGARRAAAGVRAHPSRLAGDVLPQPAVVGAQGIDDPEDSRDGAGPKRWVVHERDGAIDGYAVYRHKPGWGEGSTIAELRVIEALGGDAGGAPGSLGVPARDRLEGDGQPLDPAAGAPAVPAPGDASSDAVPPGRLPLDSHR